MSGTMARLAGAALVLFGLACLRPAFAVDTLPILIVGDAAAIPGGRANVTVSIAGTEDRATAVLFDVLVDEEVFSLETEEVNGIPFVMKDCVLAPRLRGETILVAGLPLEPREDGVTRLRVFITVHDLIAWPPRTFGDGDLVTCSFRVSELASLGPRAVVAATASVADENHFVICGEGEPPPCGTADGTVTIEQATPTPTAVATETPTATPTPTSTPTVAHRAGDANCDGAVTAADLSAVIDNLALGTPPSCGSDADGNGALDSGDVDATIRLLFE